MGEQRREREVGIGGEPSKVQEQMPGAPMVDQAAYLQVGPVEVVQPTLWVTSSMWQFDFLGIAEYMTIRDKKKQSKETKSTMEGRRNQQEVRKRKQLTP